MKMSHFIRDPFAAGAASCRLVRENRGIKPLLQLAGVLGVASSLIAAEIKLPEETSRLAESKLPGYALATTYCYTCHSTDYMQYQPNTNTRAIWKASVVKMQKIFGAQIPDSAVDPIAEYLARTYGAERGK
jgi:hypothetical protein